MSTPRLHVAEPPPHYRLRPPLVVDCSVVAGTVFSEPWQADADAQLTGRDLHAPYLLQCEIASVALKKARAGLAELAADGIQSAADMAIELHGIEEGAVVALAQRYQLTAYDAAYLWLAAELKAPLATFDRRLGVAAQRHLSTLE